MTMLHNVLFYTAGGDGSKPLSFTVDLDDSLEEKEGVSELPSVQSSGGVASGSSGGEKLSNFLPENLRKSFRERRERLSMSAEKQKQDSNIIEVSNI